MDKQFDPHIAFDQILTEVELQMQIVSASLGRLGWLRGKIADEVRSLREAAGAVETLTEPQAAEIFHVTPGQFAELRRRHRLPHCKLGNVVRYTRQQMAEIADMLAINSRSGGRRPAVGSQLKRAA